MTIKPRRIYSVCETCGEVVELEAKTFVLKILLAVLTAIMFAAPFLTEGK